MLAVPAKTVLQKAPCDRHRRGLRRRADSCYTRDGFRPLTVCGKRREQTIILIVCKETSAASKVAKCEIEQIFGRKWRPGEPGIDEIACCSMVGQGFDQPKQSASICPLACPVLSFEK